MWAKQNIESDFFLFQEFYFVDHSVYRRWSFGNWKFRNANRLKRYAFELCAKRVKFFLIKTKFVKQSYHGQTCSTDNCITFSHFNGEENEQLFAVNQNGDVSIIIIVAPDVCIEFALVNNENAVQ